MNKVGLFLYRESGKVPEVFRERGVFEERWEAGCLQLSLTILTADSALHGVAASFGVRGLDWLSCLTFAHAGLLS